ncbi:MAG: hypothetical protein U0M02_14340 [Acutalibacteraceae bacterium]|nr:hypothetical protein [Acutalibacteraceae bacterium]
MMKKLTALFLAVVMILPVAGVSASADGAAEKNYIIDDPYARVDWDEWQAYKTQLHCHTTASDGFLTVKEFVQEHYDLNFDIVALTDHGTLNLGWNVAPEVVPIMRAIKKERTKNAPVIPLTDEEYTAYTNGTAPSDRRTHTNGMLDVPLGIELNMATPVADCHLTGYYAEYGQGLAGVYGDYETPSKGVKDAGGISMLSHVGEYVYPDKDSANYVGQPVDDYYATKFAKVFLDNKGSSLGMGINSATDAHTRCDRILYDQILQKTIPNGVVPWANSFADSHNWDAVNDAYTMSLMPELTNDAFRSCLENGEFFSISHYSNGVELNGMPEMPGFDEQKVYDTKSFLLDNTPMVTRVTVNQDDDTITIEGTNFDEITWVSDCNVIRRESNITSGKATLDLHADDLLDEPYLYVRFYITGDNGICYSQPFVLNVEGEEFAPVEVEKVYDLPWFLRALVTVIDLAVFRLNPVIWIFKYFALGYNPVSFDRLINPF